MSKSIGIYHQIDLEALELLASLRAKGVGNETVREEIQRLGSQIGISKPTIRKRTAPARKAWIGSNSPLVERAASMFLGADEDQRLALHAAVLIRAYPFFLDVLTEVGKAEQLGSTIRQATVRDRISRSYGQEGNVQQGVQKVLQTLVSWGLIGKAEKPGDYKTQPLIPLTTETAELLTACIIDSGEKDALPLEGVHRNPALFAFDIPRFHLDEGSYLTEFSEGGDRRFIRLKEDPLDPHETETSDPRKDLRLDEF